MPKTPLEEEKGGAAGAAGFGDRGLHTVLRNKVGARVQRGVPKPHPLFPAKLSTSILMAQFPVPSPVQVVLVPGGPGRLPRTCLQGEERHM